MYLNLSPPHAGKTHPTNKCGAIRDWWCFRRGQGTAATACGADVPSQKPPGSSQCICYQSCVTSCTRTQQLRLDICDLAVSVGQDVGSTWLGLPSSRTLRRSWSNHGPWLLPSEGSTGAGGPTSQVAPRRAGSWREAWVLLHLHLRRTARCPRDEAAGFLQSSNPRDKCKQ